MASSFSKQVIYNKKALLAIVVPQLHKDGMHYEINIQGYPRFYMAWSPLGRYDILDTDLHVPYDLVLSVSDVIEQNIKRKQR